MISYLLKSSSYIFNQIGYISDFHTETGHFQHLVSMN
jgi:hypothetical protein